MQRHLRWLDATKHHTVDCVNEGQYTVGKEVYVSNKLDEMKALFEEFVADVQKFEEKKNKSAGLRARKATTKLGELFLQFRKASVALEKNF